MSFTSWILIQVGFLAAVAGSWELSGMWGAVTIGSALCAVIGGIFHVEERIRRLEDAIAKGR
jgi:hypothetical protein